MFTQMVMRLFMFTWMVSSSLYPKQGNLLIPEGSCTLGGLSCLHLIQLL